MLTQLVKPYQRRFDNIGILAGKVRCWQLLVLSQGLLFLSALTFSVSDSFLPTFLARGIVGFASMSLKSSVFSLIESTSLSTNFPSRTAAIASSAGGLLFGPIIGAAFESNVVAIFCAVALPFIAFLSYKLGEQVPFDVQKTTSLVLLFRDFNSSFPLFCVAQAAAATTFVILFLSDIVIERLRISDAALAAICAIFIMCFALSSNLSSLIASRHPLNVVISISLIATGVLPIFFAFPHSLFALEPLLILFPAASALLFVFAASSLSQDIEPLQLYIAVSVAQAVGSLLGGTVAIVSDLFVSPENTAYLAGLILSCISVGAAYFGRAHTKEIALNVNSGLIDFPVMFAF